MDTFIVFFWGNPGQQATKAVATYVTGFLTGSQLTDKRNYEKIHVRTETDRQMAEKKQNGMQWTDIDHYNSDKAETRREVIKNETTILNIEQKLQDGYETFKEWANS